MGDLDNATNLKDFQGEHLPVTNQSRTYKQDKKQMFHAICQQAPPPTRPLIGLVCEIHIIHQDHYIAEEGQGIFAESL